MSLLRGYWFKAFFQTYHSLPSLKNPLSTKIKNQLWKLEFVNVLAELITIPVRKQKEWLDLFFEQRDKARNLEANIEETKREIDTQVYAFYDPREGENQDCGGIRINPARTGVGN